MLITSLLGFFNCPKFEDASWILFGGDGPPLGTMSQKSLEVRFARLGLSGFVHFLNRAKSLNGHIIYHRAGESVRVALPRPLDPVV